MSKYICILLIALVFEAVGVVFLSKGLKEIGEVTRISASEISSLIARGAKCPSLLLGILFEAIFFGALLYLLSQRDVSLIWPLTSLGFVITALAARFFLNEQVSWVRWCGVVLIVAGAGLVTWSEKMKEGKSREAGPAVSGQVRGR
ncbi:MAG: DMT family transporter [Verrucomicrobia bacterium]|jgi:drug/metabolite transporter (DMT)-like permease|nr:DMT family transporter [Verrucomicrobiota bacterium]